ncbi:MAG TPA: hypothetical protein VJT73_18735 [Polyangiaceae bacterium]|nr:hypothetical protein [Polyangiaceae bacterium]
MTPPRASALAPSRRAAATFAAFAALLAPSMAAAETEKGADGVYGRLDGDVDIALAAGPAWSQGGASGALFGRFSYLQTAGAYVAFTDSLGSDSAVPRRSFGLGVSVRPFFLPRWGLDLQRGPAILDLTIDSTTIDLGVLWPSDPTGHLTEKPGVELALAVEVPLVGRAAGPFLGARGALRWSGPELAYGSDHPRGIGPAIFATVSWHLLADAHLVDAGDRLMR